MSLFLTTTNTQLCLLHRCVFFGHALHKLRDVLKDFAGANDGECAVSPHAADTYPTTSLLGLFLSCPPSIELSLKVILHTNPLEFALFSWWMFSNARNVVFTGNPTFTNHVIDRASVPPEESLYEGIKILLQHVAKGAMHNSGERFDAPTCHPETRIALQDDVVGWVDEPPGGQLVTWMYGPAGAGKSAIAQTISRKLHAKGQLTGSFFFSRTSKSRGDETELIATLAYQLSLSVPATKPFIALAVLENPLVFDLSLDDQVLALIVHPLAAVHQDYAGSQRPRVIVVDGIDECRKDDNAQSRVVTALIKGLSSIPYRNHKLFITSRPEHHIVAIFRDYKPDLLREMELNKKWKPDDDIRTFLNAGFADIRRTHPYFESNPADPTWPRRVDINALVARSSGQFIYASVVIKYIKSEDYYDPAARLEVILKLKNNEDRPFAELDALYEYMFSQIRGVEKVLTVLSLERMLSECRYIHPTSPLSLILSDFMGARIEEIKFWLRPLVSLLVWEKDVIRYIHASLPDFLVEQNRSSTFCIYSTSIATGIVRRALDLLQDEHTLTRYSLIPVLLEIPPYYTKRLPAQHRIHVHSMISNFDVVKTVLSRIHVGLLSHRTTMNLTSYLDWILTESESSNAVECRNALLFEPLSQIQTWMIQHLANESFGGANNTDKVDLWPFFISSIETPSMCWGESLRRQIYTNALLALHVCEPTRPSWVIAQEDVDVSDQTVLLYCLMSHNSQWLARTDLLGRNAITSERYTTALLRTSRYLLRLPKDQHAEGLDDADPDDPHLSASMILASKVFSKFMSVVPQSVELYFFVLYMRSVIKKYRQIIVKKVFRGQGYHETAALMITMIDKAKLYLAKTKSHFPVLNDPKSPEYARAKANAEETWQIGGNFPISSVLDTTSLRKSRKSKKSIKVPAATNSTHAGKHYKQGFRWKQVQSMPAGSIPRRRSGRVKQRKNFRRDLLKPAHRPPRQPLPLRRHPQQQALFSPPTQKVLVTNANCSATGYVVPPRGRPRHHHAGHQRRRLANSPSPDILDNIVPCIAGESVPA
ncbi:hypothetical protein D9619_000213 [Psilocybe cf. subviscida]|uniref:NACHT domain-containing protein n=1 Tax=Psilocybe cf. subviscida TaxID=2480587 RepID=A0A8H5BG36_9AGAR|nr:hypothetical protein D9619_000213 [Psilocybe cf. subviscida]